MGGTDSREEEAKSLDSYQIIGTEDDKGLGEVSVYKDKSTGDLIWVKDIIIEDDSTYSSLLKKHVVTGDYLSPMFITNKVIWISNETGGISMCKSCHYQSKYIVLMEYFERDLEKEIELRNDEELKDYFPEEEIWYILEQTVLMEEFLKTKGRYHHDLMPGKVFITEEGHIKYTDPILVDHGHSAYMKALTGNVKPLIPPEVFALIKSKELSPVYNQELYETWTIGILMLGVTVLEKESEYYNWNEKKINSRNLEISIASIKMRYSPLLSELISRLLKEKPSERLQMSGIHEYIERRKKKVYKSS